MRTLVVIISIFLLTSCSFGDGSSVLMEKAIGTFTSSALNEEHTIVTKECSEFRGTPNEKNTKIPYKKVRPILVNTTIIQSPLQNPSVVDTETEDGYMHFHAVKFCHQIKKMT